MAEKNVIQLDVTSITTGSYMEITIPDGIGGYFSRRIAFADFIIAIKEGLTIEKLVDQNIAFPKVFDAGTKLECIDFQYMSGSNVKIKVGTSFGGTEISLAELPVAANGNVSLALNRIFDSTDTIYVSISGGVVHINFKYFVNWF